MAISTRIELAHYLLHAFFMILPIILIWRYKKNLEDIKILKNIYPDTQRNQEKIIKIRRQNLAFIPIAITSVLIAITRLI